MPYDTVKYYYRLKNHKFFFDNFGVKFKKILELMSRDFFIKFKSKKDALNNIKLIKNIETLEGEKIFSDLQIKGKDLFLTLNYNKEIKNQIIKNKLNQNIKLVDFVDFVAIKNGKHHGKGYLYMNNHLKKKKVNIIKIKEKIINLF